MPFKAYRRRGRWPAPDSGTVNEEIVSRRSLYIMIVAAIIIVGMINGIGRTSVGYRKWRFAPA